MLIQFVLFPECLPTLEAFEWAEGFPYEQVLKSCILKETQSPLAAAGYWPHRPFPRSKTMDQWTWTSKDALVTQTVCILQKWMLWWIEGKYLQLHTELRKQNGEVPPLVHISIFSMASFCKIELNPPPKKRPGYKKRAVVPTYVSGLGHAVSFMLSIPPSVMQEQGWCNSTALYKNPLLWRSEVCSSGLALPGKLLVECIFKRCWPFLLLWRTEFQNTTAGAERQFYKHSKNLKAICSSLPFSTYHIWETESEEAKNPQRL